MHRLKSAVAASFLPLWVPSLSSVTSGGMAPRAPIVILFPSTTERLKSVAAAFSRASMLPFLSTFTMPGTAPEDTMLPLLSSHMERLRRAVTACSWVRESDVERRVTRRGIAPASAIATRLSALRFARRRISPAADLWSSGFPDVSFRRRISILVRSAGEQADVALLGRELLGRFGGSRPFASHHWAIRLRRT